MMQKWSLGHLMAVAACPACGSEARDARPYCIKDHLGTNLPDVWNIWRCSSCASLFLDPRPDDASIPATYQAYYTHQLPQTEAGGGVARRSLWALFRGYLGARFGWNERPAVGVGKWLCAMFPPLKLKLDYLARHLFLSDFPDRGLLLDIGCGNGEFLVIAEKMGWRVYGLEPDPMAAQACKEQGFTVFEGVLDSLPHSHFGSFDVVTSSNCIEHVPDPRQFLAAAYALLKPDGRVWLATPNPEGIGIRVFGRCWRGLEPSRHMCVPSQRQLARLLTEVGFEDIRILPRGAHGKTITRESALVARIEASAGLRVPWLSAWMARPVRTIASLLGTLSPRYSEETVVTARRGSSPGSRDQARGEPPHRT